MPPASDLPKATPGKGDGKGGKGKGRGKGKDKNKGKPGKRPKAQFSERRPEVVQYDQGKPVADGASADRKVMFRRGLKRKRKKGGWKEPQ